MDLLGVLRLVTICAFSTGSTLIYGAWLLFIASLASDGLLGHGDHLHGQLFVIELLAGLDIALLEPREVKLCDLRDPELADKERIGSLSNLIRMQLRLELPHQEDQLVAAGQVEVLLETIDALGPARCALLHLQSQDLQAPSSLPQHRSLETGGGKPVLWSMHMAEFSKSPLTGSMDARDRTERLEEVRQASSSSLQTRSGPSAVSWGEEPRIALDLLGEVAVLSDSIDNDRILLALLLEEVAGCDLRQAQYVREVSVLVTGELCDVSLCDLLQSELSLHLLQVLSSLALSCLLLALAFGLLLLRAHPLGLLGFVLVLPFPLYKVHQLAQLQLLEFAESLVLLPLCSALDIKNLAVEQELLLEHLDLGCVAVSEIRGLQVDSGPQSHGVCNDLDYTNGLEGIACVLINFHQGLNQLDLRELELKLVLQQVERHLASVKHGQRLL